MRSTEVSSALVAALWLAGSLAAQDGRGPLALEVQVEDAKGKNVAGAEVRLVYLAPEGGALPSVLTDARGEVTVGGLSAGRWTVEVRHPGHMTYLAEVALAGDAKPQVLAASQQMAPGATSTLKVRFARGRGERAVPAQRPASVAQPAAPGPPPVRGAPPAAEPVATPSPVAVPPPPAQQAPAPPRPAPAPEAARIPSPPVEKPAAAAPTPVVAHPVPQSPAPAGQPRPEAPKAAPAAPPPDAPTPVAPVPEPAVRPQPAQPPPPKAAIAEAAPAGEPAAAPVAAAPTVPPPVAPLPAPTLEAAPAAPQPAPLPTARPRVCVECPPGESAAWGEATISTGSTEGCPGDLAARLAAVPLEEVDELAASIGGGCRVVQVALPAGARYTGFRFEAQSASVTADCLPGRECPSGGCRFPFAPVVRRAGQRTVLLAAFASAVREPRRALVVGYSTYDKKR